MGKESGKKRLYSFYIDPEILDKLTRLSGFLTGSGKRVTVSNLINLSCEQFIERNQESLSAMENLSKSVQEFNKSIKTVDSPTE